MLSRSHNRRMPVVSPPLQPPQGATLVLGAGGGLGAALVQALASRGESVIALGRHTVPALDYSDDPILEQSYRTLRAVNDAIHNQP